MAMAWAAPGLAGQPLTVSSPGFKDGDKLPRACTCDGGEHSPALNVSDLPGGAKSLAVLMIDLDAPKAKPALWMVYNIPPGQPALPENLPKTRALKNEALQLPAANGKMGYAGPCPPPGATRRYQIEVFALDCTLDLPETSGKREFLQAVEGHILARGMISGKYKH